MLQAQIFLLTPCRCLEEEMIISHCVRANHNLFTEWIMVRSHTEWCYMWQDENTALRWHHCSDYMLEILLLAQKVNPFSLCFWLSFWHSPAVFHVLGLQTIIIYYYLSPANRKMLLCRNTKALVLWRSGEVFMKGLKISNYISAKRHKAVGYIILW